MLFNSLLFILAFLPVTAAVYFFLCPRSHHLSALWLAAASLFFYGWWNFHYVFLLLGSILFNYGAGYLLGRIQPRSKLLLTIAVALNLALLGYYKYSGFFIGALDQWLEAGWSLGNIVLPLGISFFTFTQIAFLVDTYQGKVREYNFVHYLLFVTYFPHLIAGPILHHAQMMPQFARRTTFRLHADHLAIGLTIFIIGLLKKVALADTFGSMATPIFSAVEHGASPMLMEAWIGALSYTLQLYFDFSGYSDMAIGISYLFNIRLPLNFNSPYKATNIIDFWRRWHMTLSAFLRDYLYIPLGGNRHGPFRRYFNLMVTMLLGGLWHGAGWTFVIWGGLHGFYLALNHAFQTLRRRLGWPDGYWGRTGRVVSTGVTFLGVVVAWVFFRAHDFHDARVMLQGMAGGNGLSLFNSSYSLPPAVIDLARRHGIVFEGFTPLTVWMGVEAWLALPEIALGLLIVWCLPNTQEWMRLSPAEDRKSEPVPAPAFTWRPASPLTWMALGTAFALIVLDLAAGPASEFLYFQF